MWASILTGLKGAFQSKKFQTMTIAYVASVVIMVVYVVAVALKLPVTEELISKAIYGVLALAGVYVSGQSVADGLSKGATSGVAQTAFAAGVTAAQREQQQSPG